MTISIADTATVNLTGTIPTGTVLDLYHGSQSFSANGDNLFNELILLNTSEVVVHDFVMGRSTHQMYAWQVLSDGSLAPWTRSAANSSSGSVRDLDADVLMIAVPDGVAVPTPEGANGPPAPGTSQRIVKLKIRKQGHMPLR